ncbi:hypothetical protein BGZ63DRAFT_390503 [Mariannaea sp. PMI_226]|nr:hypothetical protein BGZ63DRAFT_390503 [Mariannaea sp. PMI_226]
MSSSSSVSSPAKLVESRGACGSCHRYKERCVFDHEDQACRKCRSLSRTCIPRAKKRMGRRPELGNLPHGTCSIIELAPDPRQEPRHHFVTNAKRGTISTISANPADCVQPTTTKRLDASLNAPWVEPSGYWEEVARTNSSRFTFNPYPLKAPFKLYTKFDSMLGTKEGFFGPHRQFMLGRGFIDEFQAATRLVFTRAPPVLMSAYSATLQLMSYRKTRLSGIQGFDVGLGSQCLEWLGLQSSCIGDLDHAAVVLMVGQLLLVYNTLLPCRSSRTITRGVLLSAKDWYPALLQHPQFDPVTLAPLFLDTVDSLIRRDRPIIRVPQLHRHIVDRFLGLCAPLLSLLSDLCERSYEVKVHASIYPLGDFNHDPYADIERQIKSWTIEWPPDFFTKYEASEIAVMLAQAHSYRHAALLVIHRLRFPLGVQDNVGYGYAKKIMDELSFMAQWPPDGATGLGLDFPLMVAMMETPRPGKELFSAFNLLRFQPHVAENILQMVGLIRMEYERGYDGLWFDLVEDSMLDILIP